MDFLDSIIKKAKKSMTEYLGWEDGQKHDETQPTVYSERRKQMEKNKKNNSNEAIFDFSQSED